MATFGPRSLGSFGGASTSLTPTVTWTQDGVAIQTTTYGANVDSNLITLSNQSSANMGTNANSTNPVLSTNPPDQPPAYQLITDSSTNVGSNVDDVVQPPAYEAIANSNTFGVSSQTPDIPPPAYDSIIGSNNSTTSQIASAASASNHQSLVAQNQANTNAETSCVSATDVASEPVAASNGDVTNGRRRIMNWNRGRRPEPRRDLPPAYTDIYPDICTVQ